MSLDIYLYELKEVTVFDINITHNLTRMANEAGLYRALWAPEEIDATKAKDIVPFLEAGLKRLKEDPVHFRGFNPENGWGNYEGLVEVVEAYLEACKNNPDARIEVDS